MDYFGVWVMLLVVLAFKIYQDLSYDKKYQNPSVCVVWIKNNSNNLYLVKVFEEFPGGI